MMAKGDSTTHIYTEKGRDNHDSIKWDSDKKETTEAHCVEGVDCDVNDCFYCPNIPQRKVEVNK